MASAALPPSHPSTHTPPESPLSRMSHHQFFSPPPGSGTASSGGAGGGSVVVPPSSNSEMDSYGHYGPASEPYYATSGSNSGEEDEVGSKRSGSNNNNNNQPGCSGGSKKRRKQSKPLRLGEPEEDHRRYSTEEEEGTRRSSCGDSPLNLSQTPALRVLGPELLSSPESGELIAGKLPTGGLYAGGMLPFGLGPPFPFPFTPGKPGLGSPGVHPRGSQIFNPEAYCELCNKEFCNKYFLKTHKANKHGIYTDPTTTSTTNSSSSSGASPSENPGLSNGKSSSNSGPSFLRGPPPPGFLPPLSPPLATKDGPSSPGQRENGELRRSSPLGRLMFGAAKDHSDRIPAKSSFSQEKLRQMGVINADAFCEICCKEFCNKYFLRVHKLKKHGICSPDLPPEKVQKILSQMAKEAGKTGQPPPQLVRPHKNSDDVDGTQEEEEEEEEEGELIKRSSNTSSEELQRLQSMISELKGDRRQDGEDNHCKICSKDMENKFFLRAHLLNEHGILSPEPKEPLFLPPPPNGNDFTSKFLQQMSKGLSLSGTHNTSSSSEEERNYLERLKGSSSHDGRKNNQQLLLDPKDPNRRPASLSRSYCEICKKELCNKYFMKTHMMKMHGINIDGASPGIGLGNGGVSCHICKKELCSKYFLKVHLQNTHGLTEEGLPLGPQHKENNGTPASSLFPSLFPPPPPSSSSSNTHGPLGIEHQAKDPQFYGDKHGYSGNKEEAPFACPFCGEDLKELVLLQVHIIRSHGAFPSSEANPASRLFPGEDEDVHCVERKSPKTPPRSFSSSHGHPPPSKASPSSSSLSSDKQPSSSPPEQQQQPSFPHIEMLQRHMLSTQFQGLINPLLSGLAAGGSYNPIQKLLSPPPEAPNSSTAKKKTTTRRVFKCPKCSQRFRRRELCLSHMSSEHGVVSIRRKLRFSPLKKGALLKKSTRSKYVRHFMELLKFPTSRATPRSSSDSHIMQPFLLKAEMTASFVPSLIYLPVEKRVTGPTTVAFNLIPA